MAIQISGTTVIDNSRNINAGIATFSSLNVPPIPLTFNPSIGATSVVLESNIIITFSQLLTKGTGNITLRENSAGGTAFSTIGVSSSSVTISGSQVTINPPSNIGIAVTTFVVVDAGAFSGVTTTSLSPLINNYSFTTIPLTFSSITPSNAATEVSTVTNITLTFNTPPIRGTGTIELRSGSTSGTIVESFNAASSDRISISSNDYIIDPTSSLAPLTSFHTIIPSTAIGVGGSTSLSGFAGINTTGANTHSFTTEEFSVGTSFGGGFLICKASPLRWIVSPPSAEVSRTWYNRNDANTTSQQVSGCTGWFVPTFALGVNPGYLCRNFWGPSPCYSATKYWSSDPTHAAPYASPGNNFFAKANAFYAGGQTLSRVKSCTYCVRAFRCVTY